MVVSHWVADIWLRFYLLNLTCYLSIIIVTFVLNASYLYLLRPTFDHTLEWSTGHGHPTSAHFTVTAVTIYLLAIRQVVQLFERQLDYLVLARKASIRQRKSIHVQTRLIWPWALTFRL